MSVLGGRPSARPPLHVVINTRRDPGFVAPPCLSPAPIEFHRSCLGYACTPVVSLEPLARAIGVGGIVVKNEQERLGLLAYKVLGSSWALHQEIRRRLGLTWPPVVPFADLREMAARLGEITLCAASAGNHGLGVAAMAEALGFRCAIFVPAGTASGRIEAIARRGATVHCSNGTYDETFAAAERVAAGTGYWFCPDTSYGASTEFVMDVEDGYDTLFREMVGQMDRVPDVFFVQVGAGVLAAAAVKFIRRRSPAARIISVEPHGSNCLQASIAAGGPATVPDHDTIMAGLRCQSVSVTAWPTLSSGVDAALSIGDERAREAMRVLARAGVVAGASGAAGLGGLLAIASDGALRSLLKIDRSAIVGVINTEGAADPANYDAVIKNAAQDP